MEVLSIFRGITTPTPQLLQQIAQYGWQPKVKWDNKLGAFVAEAKNPNGETLKKSGPNDRTALGNLLIAVVRHNHMRTAAQYRLGMGKNATWQNPPASALEAIAQEYAQAPVYDPKAAAYFQELGQDSNRRAEVIKRQMQVEITDQPEPYTTAQEMLDDIHKNKHILISRANSEHPVWDIATNVNFRLVHDVMGHGVSGGNFDWTGELQACSAHSQLLTPTAQVALLVDCVFQTAYASYYRSFGPQKVFVPKLYNPLDNPGVDRGIHPSQTVVPTQAPAVQPFQQPKNSLPEGSIAPHQEALGLTPLMSPTFAKRYASALMDPNEGWSSGFSPMTVAEHGVGNAYLDHGDPLESGEVMDNAAKIDTGWHSLKTGDGQFDEARAKQAIVNAFRVVLLSPRKDLRWNAQHYQDIAHIPADVDYPKVYWDALESRRRAWNQAQGIDPNSHMPYFKYLKPFESVIHQLHPELGFQGAKQKADETLFDWWTEEQQRIETEDAEKPTDKQRSVDEIERRANESLARRIQVFLKDKTDPKTDVAESNPEHLRLFGSEDYVQKIRNRFNGLNLEDATVKFKASQIENFLDKKDIPDGPYKKLMKLYGYLAKTKGKNVTAEDIHDAWVYWTVVDRHDTTDDCLVPYGELSSKSKAYDEPYKQAVQKVAAGGQYNLLTGDEGLRYGAFMGTHLKAISQVSKHADELLNAALEDVKSHDGTGHHFRAITLSLGISGVGPKVASFAWLLLQPLTSQLATIDTHMMDVLGHKYEKDMNTRDYFKFEQELAAGRDAAGYSHVPLGAFQWGMWDAKRTGLGTHQDHSAMRVLDPTPHQYIDWNAKVQPIGGGHAEEFKQNWAANAPDWWRNTQPARDAAATEFNENVAPGFPQNAIPYQVGGDPRLASVLKQSGESEDEFHVGIAVPEDMVQRLSEIAKELDLKKPEEAAEYHITAFWSEKGYSDKELHDWIRQESISGYRFENARIDCFPSHKGDWAVVLRLDAPEAKKHVQKMMAEAEDRGLEIRKFDGGWKAHITLGYQDEKVKPQKFPDVQFRSGPMYVSIPRPLRRTADFDAGGFSALNLPAPFASYADGEQDIGAPGETAMSFAHSLHPDLSVPEIWALMGEDGAGKLDGSGKSYATQR